MSRPKRAPRRISGGCWRQRSRPISTRGLFIQQVLETPPNEIVHAFARNLLNVICRFSVEQRLECFFIAEQPLVGFSIPLICIKSAQLRRDFKAGAQGLE